MNVTDMIPTEPVLVETGGFRFGQVPPTRELALAPQPAPDLGAIASFVGTFKGNGLNTIFRPQNVAVSPTPLPNPAHGQDDNILELNLTEEVLSFSPALGSVPNRGFVQGDVFLNGVPYLQTINDISDPANPVIGIHFEPGIWLSVPPTDVPEEGPTLARLGSIPHGTTIEAQGKSFPPVPGPPDIAPVDITPFLIGSDQKTDPVRFLSQEVNDPNTFRLPQDLTSFINAGTITQTILDDPNTVLRNRIAGQTITSTTTIVINTQPAAPLFGGGNANIAFLLGDPAATNPNANAVQMSAIFWIETVSETITVPAPGQWLHSPGQVLHRPGQPLILQGDTGLGGPVAHFAVSLTKELTTPTQIEVTYTQIQYTQTVFLNFAGLTWPHVSVATLVPNDPIPVTL